MLIGFYHIVSRTSIWKWSSRAPHRAKWHLSTEGIWIEMNKTVIAIPIIARRMYSTNATQPNQQSTLNGEHARTCPLDHTNTLTKYDTEFKRTNLFALSYFILFLIISVGYFLASSKNNKTSICHRSMEFNSIRLISFGFTVGSWFCSWRWSVSYLPIRRCWRGPVHCHSQCCQITK